MSYTIRNNYWAAFLLIALTLITACSDIDPCASITCRNAGVCIDGTCDCPEGFSGEDCEIAVDPCIDINCANGGVCDDGTCDCPDGFSGANCEVEADPCIDINCENGGVCDDGTCDCPDGFSGVNCEIEDQPASLNLQTAFGSTSSLSVVTQGIFAIWWDPRFDHTTDAPILFEILEDIREDCLNNLSMQDPPNPTAGYYYNVYIHHGADDLLPDEWGNGQGTDQFGQPFLALPAGLHLELSNVLHEGFHVFQYSSDSPGFVYDGDSQWYTESAAEWYASINNPGADRTFIQSIAKSANPQLALWHSFNNRAPGDPVDWLYEVQQYGLQSYFFFLTNVSGVDPSVFSSGFYGGVRQLPQEYMYEQIGGDALRGYFADWAAHNAGGFDYLTPAQIAVGRNELDHFVNANPQYLHPLALELTDQGTNTAFSPAVGFKPRGWSYNVIKINNTQAATYTFQLAGDTVGSEGAAAHFEARLVTISNNGTTYDTVTMTDTNNGSITKTLTATDTEMYLVIAAVAEHWTGNQTYDYNLDITRQ